ncbi:sodium:solute symporter family protein [Fontisphaera persica]|uniref:sodium:solute symporter family protein n=1 Tax=Fontisphaera persica TaxID=2974023 RepID=UPI0024BFF475|nr:sodium:solute symporter family protein [Fontisphaera persica]WCJ59980.1 sodium:solute symporter family protein [Fontisphaera persica]
MNPAIIVFIYLAIVLYIGIFAFRKGKQSGEDYFLASRSLGTWVFLLSLFGTNMTAFAILGSSGLAYQRGIGVYGLMASASGFVIPLTIFFIGTRLWALGKKYGHMTQVQYFRDRWECGHIGTAIFALTAAMLVPYIIIGVMGGGQTLEAISTVMGPDKKPVMVEVMRGGQTVLEPKHLVSYEVGGAIVALVVMSYVFFGGMRGTAWVNTFQTVMFLCFGTLAFILIGRNLGGFEQLIQGLAANPKTAPLLTRERIPVEEFFSYTFIPLSSIMFPHIAIMCMTAKKAASFKRTVIFYPICIMLIWLPSVFLGVVAAGQFPGLKPGESDDVILRLLSANTSLALSGLLGAAIMACVMASDSQILALCTMFTEDVFAYYGGKERFGDKVQVWTGRAFVVAVTVVAYLIAIELKDKAGIFELAIRFAFSGFAALAPVMLAALFWKRSTKWGALASVVWVAASMVGTYWLFEYSIDIAPKAGQPPVPIFPELGNLFLRTPGNVTIYGYLPVMFMVLGSAVMMVVFSLLTRPPSAATLNKYFPPQQAAPVNQPAQAQLAPVA